MTTINLDTPRGHAWDDALGTLERAIERHGTGVCDPPRVPPTREQPLEQMPLSRPPVWWRLFAHLAWRL